MPLTPRRLAHRLQPPPAHVHVGLSNRIQASNSSAPYIGAVVPTYMRYAVGGPGTLPVAAEVDRRPAPHRQSDDAIDLLAVADAAEILPPGRLAGVADEIRPGDVVLMAGATAAQTGEIGSALLVQAPPMLKPS